MLIRSFSKTISLKADVHKASALIILIDILHLSVTTTMSACMLLIELRFSMKSWENEIENENESVR